MNRPHENFLHTPLHEIAAYHSVPVFAFMPLFSSHWLKRLGTERDHTMSASRHDVRVRPFQSAKMTRVFCNWTKNAQPQTIDTPTNRKACA